MKTKSVKKLIEEVEDDLAYLKRIALSFGYVTTDPGPIERLLKTYSSGLQAKIRRVRNRRKQTYH